MVTSVKLDENLKSRIQHLAEVKERTAHCVMKKAIREYVEREEAKDRFRQEALESWEEYQQTGLHLTGEEVQDWLSTWGTDQEAEAPQCHS